MDVKDDKNRYDIISSEETSSMINRTRKMIASELEDMLREIPLEKVRVLDLCERCDISPQTFYYYFKDKYELVAWVFINDIYYVFGNMVPFQSSEKTTNLMSSFLEKKAFYRKVFSDNSQNALSLYIHRFNTLVSRTVVEEYTGHPLTVQELVMINYHSHGIIDTVRDWILDELNISVEELGEFCYRQTPDLLYKALASYSKPMTYLLNEFGQEITYL